MTRSSRVTPAQLDDPAACRPRYQTSRRRSRACSPSSCTPRSPPCESIDPAARPVRRAPRGDAVLAGGKRLRPTFAYWGWRGVAGPDAPADGMVPGAGRAGAAAHVRAGPRRRDGRLRHPARPAHRHESLAGQHADGGTAGRPGPVRRARRPSSSAISAWSGPTGCSRAPTCRHRRCSRPAAATTGCGSRRSPGSTSTCSARRSPTVVGRRGRCGWPGSRPPATRSSAPLLFGAALAGPHADGPSARHTPLRHGGRRGVPAPRRPARGVRRPGRHRQAGRRRPAHRQADRAARARPADGDAGAAQAACRRTATSPRLADLVDGHRRAPPRWRT